MKVLYFTNLPVPYRMDFFNELGKLCDLTVWVETEKRANSNSDWLKRSKAETFSYRVLDKFEFSRTRFINFGYKKLLKQENFEIVVVGSYYSPSAMLFIETLRLMRIPYILNSDGGFIKNDSILKKWIKRHFIKGASAYLSTGAMTDEYLLHYGARKEVIYRYPFTSIHQSDILDKIPDALEKQALRQQLGISEDKMILSVGSCIRRKGYDILLQACKYIPENVGIYLIGGKPTDDQLENLKSYVAENSMHNVHFISFLSKEKLSLYYKAADLFVLPTREDVWGLVINEAMAYGLPVVTTNRCIAGVEMVRENLNGYIVSVGNIDTLAGVMMHILSTDTLKNNMSNYSLEVISGYSLEKMAERHYEVFQLMVK